MPFEIKKVGTKYKLQRIKDKTFIKTSYNSKESAINAGIRFMKYKHKNKNPKVIGNKIL